MAEGPVRGVEPLLPRTLSGTRGAFASRLVNGGNAPRAVVRESAKEPWE